MTGNIEIYDGLKAQQYIAQGNALGTSRPSTDALKGQKCINHDATV